MSMKLQPSSRVFNKQTKKYEHKHYYAKQYTTQALFDMLESANTKPKIKQKVRKELQRRNKA